MSVSQIHWHEGLFMQPHHLQTAQKMVVDSCIQERQFAHAYGYGVIDSELSLDALENMLIQFKKLKVIMPSGMVVDFPANASLPTLNIKKEFSSSPNPLTIYLALPLWHQSKSNTSESLESDWRVKKVYGIKETEIADENTGHNEQQVMVRVLNARLALEDDDFADMEKIPILRIAHSTEEAGGLPRVDANFSAPAFTLKGSKQLWEICRDLVNQLEASRNKMIEQQNRTQAASEAINHQFFSQFVQMQVLCKYCASLPSMLQNESLSPFSMYVKLRELHAELCSVEASQEKLAAEDYDHDRPLLNFSELSKKIRNQLRDSVVSRFTTIDFDFEDTMYKATMQKEHFASDQLYYLGIKTTLDSSTLVQMVENGDQFKLMPFKDRNKAIYGVKLKEEKFPPLELPSQMGLHYFKLNVAESNYIWEQIQAEGDVVIRLKDTETEQMTIKLFIVPMESME